MVNQDAGAVAIKMVDQWGVPIAGTAVTYTLSPRGNATLRSGAGEPAVSPASSTTSVTCNTDSYGVAYADVLLGTTPTSTLSVTAKAAGFSNGFSGTIRPAPQTSTGGVSDAAVGKTPIAPGSYVSIYGANLSEFTDSVTYAPYALPLTIDGVTVSFDVPSAKLSVPGHLTYVSPTQVNVQVPWELQGQTSALVKVTLYGSSFGNVVTVPLADTSPAFFENSGIAAALDGNNAIVTAATPVNRGQAVQLYITGPGPLPAAPPTVDSAPH